MNKILLDTDIYSEVLKGVDANVASRARSYRRAQGVLTISVVTVEEVLDFDPAAAELAGRIAGDLERLGRPIGVADPMIAAIAITRGMALATGNTAHFERVQRLGHPLALVDWRS